MTEPGLGSGALREAVAFVIETEGGDLYDQGRVLFSDARQAQDRADDLNSELEKESFRVAPLYRALSLSSPIEPEDHSGREYLQATGLAQPTLQANATCPCGSTEHTPESHFAQASSEVRERLAAIPNDVDTLLSRMIYGETVEDVRRKVAGYLERALPPSRQGAGGSTKS